MAEAQPGKKEKGKTHLRGRRFKQISNTAEEGELCIYRALTG